MLGTRSREAIETTRLHLLTAKNRKEAGQLREERLMVDIEQKVCTSGVTIFFIKKNNNTIDIGLLFSHKHE